MIKIILIFFILFVSIFVVTAIDNPVFCNDSYIALGYTQAQIAVCDTFLNIWILFYWFGTPMILLIVAALLITYLSDRRQKKK